MKEPSIRSILEEALEFVKPWAAPGAGAMTAARALKPKLERAIERIKAQNGNVKRRKARNG